MMFCEIKLTKKFFCSICDYINYTRKISITPDDITAITIDMPYITVKLVHPYRTQGILFKFFIDFYEKNHLNSIENQDKT